jgi:hypothetical protein
MKLVHGFTKGITIIFRVFEHLCWVGRAQPMLKFGCLWNLLGVGKVKFFKKVVCPKSNLKNNIFWYGHKKIDSKYLEVKILNNTSLHLVYGKFNSKFQQLLNHKNKLKICLKLNGSVWCTNLLHIKILIYYDYNMQNLTIHKKNLWPH